MELFVSTERILVLNTDLQEIMMDHSLRTISYIADIGDIVVLMARRNRSPSSPSSEDGSGANSAMAADLAAKRQQQKMVQLSVLHCDYVVVVVLTQRRKTGFSRLILQRMVSR